MVILHWNFVQSRVDCLKNLLVERFEVYRFERSLKIVRLSKNCSSVILFEMARYQALKKVKDLTDRCCSTWELFKNLSPQFFARHSCFVVSG